MGDHTDSLLGQTASLYLKIERLYGSLRWIDLKYEGREICVSVIML